MKLSTLPALVLGLGLVIAPVVASARPVKRPPPFTPAVTLADATKTAVAKIPGTVSSSELEREHGRWIYSFVIKPTQGKKGWVKEVNVDATSGVVVAVESEREPRHQP